MQLVQMIFHKQLLLRRAEADEEYIGLCGIDLLDDRCFILEIAVVHAADVQLRVLFCHFLRGKLRNAGLAAEQEQPAAGLFEDGQQAVGKIDARNLLLQRRFEKLRREHNACAVRQDEIGAVDERAERFVVQRLIGDLGVRGHGIAGLFARKDLFRARRGLVHRDIIKLQPHDIQFHVQAYLTNLEFIYHLSTYFRICPRNFGFNFPARCFTYGRFCINCYESEA